MLWGAHLGGLELRTEGGEIRLRASFPYGRAAVLSDGSRTGRPRHEVIAARAFTDRIQAGEDILFLASHDMNKVMASREAGTLTLLETDTELTLEARISADMSGVSYVRDFLSANSAGLVRGLSPGFRVRPGGETVEERGDTILRTIRSADLFELSAVTRPAYSDAQIEARNWEPMAEAPARIVQQHHSARWR